jgi:hypothetical protein
MGRELTDPIQEAVRDSGWQRSLLRRRTAVWVRSVALYEDSKGNLWAGVLNGLWQMETWSS